MEPWALSFRVQDLVGATCAVPQSPVLSLIFPATNLKFLILGFGFFKQGTSQFPFVPDPTNDRTGHAKDSGDLAHSPSYPFPQKRLET